MLRRTIAPLASAVALAATSLLAAQASTPAAAPAQTAPAAPKADLPSAASLFEKQLAASGGREAFEAITAMSSTASMKMPAMGVNGTMTAHFSAPKDGASAFVVLMNLPGIGDVKTGFDGTVGWSMDQMRGPRLLEGKELEQIKNDSDFRREMSLHTQYESATVVGLSTWADKPAYEILLKGRKGGDPAQSVTVFLDQATSLMTGMRMMAETPAGQVPVVTTIREYKGFEGPKGTVQLPVKTELSFMGQQQLLEVQTVEFKPIDAATFALPAEIAALVKARNEAPAAAPATQPAAQPANAPANAPAAAPTGDAPKTTPPAAPAR
jgi:hypothetical protein